jgi:hypothetical protein
MNGQIILNGLTTEELLSLMGELVSKKVDESFRKVRSEQLEEKFLSPGEVCKLFQPKISRQTLANWTKKGLLKKNVVGHSIFYRYSEVLESIKSIKQLNQ